MRRASKLRLLIVAVLAVIPLVAGGGTAVAAAGTGSQSVRPHGTCQTIPIPVALAPGQPPDQKISAEYCVPFGAKPSAVDVYDHGATYNNTYFDWPQNPSLYSWVDKSLAAGRAALDVSDLGSGQSSRPAGTTLTVQMAAYALHQVVTWARHTGGYSRVTEIGHSMGSAIVEVEANTWPSDPTRVVLTGFLNEVTPNITLFLASLQPSAYGLGYLTTDPRAGVRARYFYDTKTADPSVIAYDEEHKDVVPTGELLTLAKALLPGQGEKITAPVEIVVGQADDLLCTDVRFVNCANPANVLAYERPDFSHAASLSYYDDPDTGHDITTSTTTDEAWDYVNNWILSH